MRNVTMVVPVLMTSCQVSENANKGPLIAQIATAATAMKKAAGVPMAAAVVSHQRRKCSRMFADVDCADGRGCVRSAQLSRLRSVRPDRCRTPTASAVPCNPLRTVVLKLARRLKKICGRPL